MSEQNTENKNNNNLVKIIVWVVVFALLGFWVFAFLAKDSNSPISSLVNKVTDTLSTKKAWDFNYDFKFNWKLEVFDEDGKVMWSGGLSLWEWKIYSSSNALKQRLTLKDLEVMESGREVFKLDSIDMVSDYFKNYFNFESAQKKALLKKLENLNYPLAREVASSLSNSWTYVMVDNEKAVLKTIWDLSKNEVIKNLFLASGLSNPTAYLEETWTLEKLEKELKTDKILDYLFKNNWEAVKENWKTKQALILNDKVCVDYLPFVNNLFSQISKVSWDANPLWRWLKLEDCKQSLTDANSVLQFAMKIYKIWDLEKWNYDFVVSMWDVYESKITYESHNLKTWSIKSESPNKKDFSLNISWDASSVKNSLLKIDMENKFLWIYVKWEIKNGVWDIKIDSKDKENWAFGNIKVKDYYFENIDLKSLVNSKEMFSLKWKILKKEVNLKFNSDFREKINAELVYKDNYLKFSLDSQELKANFVCDNGKIDWNADFWLEKLVLKWDYKNSKDFSFKLTDWDNPEKNYAIFEAKKESKTIKYVARLVSDSVIEFSFDANLSEGKKEDYKTINFDWEFVSQDKRNGKVKFSLELLYKKSSSKFETPSNFKEVEISYFEMTTLPAMNPAVVEEQFRVFKKYFFPIFVSGWVIGFISYNSTSPVYNWENMQIEEEFEGGFEEEFNQDKIEMMEK